LIVNERLFEALMVLPDKFKKPYLSRLPWWLIWYVAIENELLCTSLIMNYALVLFSMRAMCETNYALVLFAFYQTILCHIYSCHLDLVILKLLCVETNICTIRYATIYIHMQQLYIVQIYKKHRIPCLVHPNKNWKWVPLLIPTAQYRPSKQ
jgi:hypothetical protein